MTDNDLAGSTPPDEEPPLSRQQEPGTSTPAGDPSRAAPGHGPYPLKAGIAAFLKHNEFHDRTDETKTGTSEA